MLMSSDTGLWFIDSKNSSKHVGGFKEKRTTNF